MQIANTKIQIPNNVQIQNPKKQTANWNLVLGICLRVGVWSLELASLCLCVSVVKNP